MFGQNFCVREWSQAGQSLYRQAHKIDAISKEAKSHQKKKDNESLSEGKEEKMTKGNKGGLAF